MLQVAECTEDAKEKTEEREQLLGDALITIIQQ